MLNCQRKQGLSKRMLTKFLTTRELSALDFGELFKKNFILTQKQPIIRHILG